MTESYRPTPQPEQTDKPEGAVPSAPQFAPPAFQEQPQQYQSYGAQDQSAPTGPPPGYAGYGAPQQGYQQQPYIQTPYGASAPTPHLSGRAAQAASDTQKAMIFAILGFLVCTFIFGPLAWVYANKSIANGGDAKVWKIVGIVETALGAFALLFFIFVFGVALIGGASGTSSM